MPIIDYSEQVSEMLNLAISEIEKSEYQTERSKAIGNIYLLYSDKELKYIGQRQEKGIRVRLGQHLEGNSYKVDENDKQIGTISKFHMVRAEREQGKVISFKTLRIVPDQLRTTLELKLIEHYKPKWNIHKQ